MPNAAWQTALAVTLLAGCLWPVACDQVQPEAEYRHVLGKIVQRLLQSGGRVSFRYDIEREYYPGGLDGHSIVKPVESRSVEYTRRGLKAVLRTNVSVAGESRRLVDYQLGSHSYRLQADDRECISYPPTSVEDSRTLSTLLAAIGASTVNTTHQLLEDGHIYVNMTVARWSKPLPFSVFVTADANATLPLRRLVVQPPRGMPIRVQDLRIVLQTPEDSDLFKPPVECINAKAKSKLKTLFTG